MIRVLLSKRLFVAGILLLALAIPSTVWAQAGVSQVLGGEAIRAEMRANDAKNRKKKQPQANQNASNKSKKKQPGAASKNFAAKVSNADFQFAPLMKVLFLFVVLWMWVGAADWVSRDAQVFRLGYYKWNAIVFFPFFLVGTLLFFLPVGTIIRAPVLLAVFLTMWVPYVVVHNKNVQPHQTVLTGPWWRFALASVFGKVGIKVNAERKAEYEKGEDVEFFAMGSEDPNTNRTPSSCSSR